MATWMKARVMCTQATLKSDSRTIMQQAVEHHGGH